MNTDERIPGVLDNDGVRVKIEGEKRSDKGPQNKERKRVELEVIARLHEDPPQLWGR